MKKFKTIRTPMAVLNIENIDTDQIIGSDHLKITNKEGLGQHLFSDWRYLATGENNPKFILNQQQHQNTKVLVAGDNFGCGSSREHAPWALLDFGIEVLISSSIADIFSNNSIKNGLLTIEVSKEQHKFLLKNDGQEIEVDLQNQSISCNQETFEFKLESFARYCLLNGIEQLDFLMNQMSKIEEYEKNYKKEVA